MIDIEMRKATMTIKSIKIKIKITTIYTLQVA